MKLFDDREINDLEDYMLNIFELIQAHPWVFVGLILAIICGAFLFLRKGREKQKETTPVAPPPIDAFAEAISAIESLQRQVPRPAAKPFVFRLSEILRLYVERKFKINAMEKTGDEFLREVMLHPFLRDGFEQILSEFISRGDDVKYSPHLFGDQETNALLHSGREFIEKAEAKFNNQVVEDLR